MRVINLAAPLLGLAVASLFSRFQRTSLIQESAFADHELLAHLSNHTLLHIGGQHRGGTTLLLSALKEHPEISSHRLHPEAVARTRRRLERQGGDALKRSGLEDLTEEEDAPFFEGIFLQDVYPRFSLDTQSTWLFRLRLRAARL